MSESSELTLRLTADLHARPAGQLVQRAAEFDASVTVSLAGNEVDVRSVLAVMRLGATVGSEVTLRAAGPDAERAVRTLASVLLGEPSEAVEVQPSR